MSFLQGGSTQKVVNKTSYHVALAQHAVANNKIGQFNFPALNPPTALQQLHK